jgi:signal peptidase I
VKRRALLNNPAKAVPVKKKSVTREYIEAFAIAIVLALFIRTFVVQAFKIPSGSMKPTLLIGDHLLVNKFIYGIKIPFLDRIIIPVTKPKTGDIVVFKYPEDESKDFIKRVVGVEGDVVEIKNDFLLINGKEVKAGYIGEFTDDDGSKADELEEALGRAKHHILDQIKSNETKGPWTVPKNSIFVMGDNRDNSQDSRYWGFVTLNKIKGKAMIIYWSWPHWDRFLKIIR